MGAAHMTVKEEDNGNGQEMADGWYDDRWQHGSGVARNIT